MTNPADEPRLDEADSILELYCMPNEEIDSGNLYFAATEYQIAYQALESRVKELEAEKINLKNVKAKQIELKIAAFAKVEELIQQLTQEKEAAQKLVKSLENASAELNDIDAWLFCDHKIMSTQPSRARKEIKKALAEYSERKK